MSETGKRLIDAAKEARSFAEDSREEQRRFDRRFVHHTRPKTPLSWDEAQALCERMANVGKKEE